MTLDRRTDAFRDDLAEISLKGKVQADRFVAGSMGQVNVPVLDLRPQPDAGSGIDTQLLLGETVRIFDQADGWAWLKADLDDYVGYARLEGLGSVGQPATHVIAVPRSFAYCEADLKRPMTRALSMGSRLTVVSSARTRGTDYLVLDTGEAVFAGHCRMLAEHSVEDYVAIAGSFLETPYLWGGRSGFGIDCSGLVQLSLMMAGKAVKRDSDMQAQGLGQLIDHEERRRGDLVFWRGHVAIFEDRDTVIHASGHKMRVTRESFTDAIDRIRPLYGEPTGYRRP